MKLPRNTTHTTWAAALSLASLLALQGCAALQPSPERMVEQRATEFWQARKQGQVENAYALASPSYRRLHTLEQYKMQFGGAASLTGVQVIKVTCEAEKCTARIKIEAAPALVGLNLGTIATHMDEVWLLEDGQWWRHHDL